MGDIEENRFTSLSSRIAALNQQHVANAALPTRPAIRSRSKSINDPSAASDAPPLPIRPLVESRSNSPSISSSTPSSTRQSNNEPVEVHSKLPPPVTKYTAVEQIRPPLPQRASTNSALIASTNGTSKPPPALPPRLPPKSHNLQLVRRESNESLSSMTSNVSSISTLSLSTSLASRRASNDPAPLRRLPPPLSEANLPPLPPSRRELMEQEMQARLLRRSSAATQRKGSNQPRPSVSRQLSAKPMPKSPIVRSTPARPPPPLPEAHLPPLPPPRRESNEAEDQAKLLGASTAGSHGMGFNQPRPPISPQISPGLAKSMPQLPTIDNTLTHSVPPRMPSPLPQLPTQPLPPTKPEKTPAIPPRRKTALIAVTESLSTKSILKNLLPPIAQRSAIPLPLNKPVSTEEAQPAKSQSTTLTFPNGAPAIPRASRPTDIQIEKILNVVPSPRILENSCLKCRDFSAPDRVAAQYPRESIQTLDTQYLAEVLCRPFNSATDKARAIFTWIHHNIAYDTVALFGNRNDRKNDAPETTLARGMTLCGGYSALFASIAERAGLESIIVSGHCKSIFYTNINPGDEVPPFSIGHGWNAVRLDGGVWKLIDATWGAGHLVPGTQSWEKSFNALHFTMSNEEFGLKHFPAEDSQFFRSDELVPTWEEYYIGPDNLGSQGLEIYGQPGKDHGIDQSSLLPKQKVIDVSHSAKGSMTRFQFSRNCEHWDHERHGPGKPYLIGVFINGIDGRGFKRGLQPRRLVALESNGFLYCADIETWTLGTSGQILSLVAITTRDGKEARGLTFREYKSSEDFYTIAVKVITQWDLV